VEVPGELDLFAEAPGRGFIVSGPAESLRRWEGDEPSARCTIIGSVGGSTLLLSGRLEVSVAELRRAWSKGLGQFF
jgi:hypothetical protein